MGFIFIAAVIAIAIFVTFSSLFSSYNKNVASPFGYIPLPFSM